MMEFEAAHPRVRDGGMHEGLQVAVVPGRVSIYRGTARPAPSLRRRDEIAGHRVIDACGRDGVVLAVVAAAVLLVTLVAAFRYQAGFVLVTNRIETLPHLQLLRLNRVSRPARGRRC